RIAVEAEPDHASLWSRIHRTRRQIDPSPLGKMQRQAIAFDLEDEELPSAADRLQLLPPEVFRRGGHRLQRGKGKWLGPNEIRACQTSVDSLRQRLDFGKLRHDSKCKRGRRARAVPNARLAQDPEDRGR